MIYSRIHADAGQLTVSGEYIPQNPRFYNRDNRSVLILLDPNNAILSPLRIERVLVGLAEASLYLRRERRTPYDEGVQRRHRDTRPARRVLIGGDSDVRSA